jgi:hypothetical protein
MAVLSRRLRDVREAQELNHGSAMLVAGHANGRSIVTEKRVATLEKRCAGLEETVAALQGDVSLILKQTRTLARRVKKQSTS